MRGLGFALGSLAGMAISMANARQRRAYELNEEGIYLCNNFRYEEALHYFLEADRLMPENEYIENNISICRQALMERRRQLSQNSSKKYETIQNKHIFKTTKSDTIKYYHSLNEIPEDLLMFFFNEKNFNFHSKADLINHSNEYWSNEDIEYFIKEIEFFKDTTPNLSLKLKEFNLLRHNHDAMDVKQEILFQQIQQSNIAFKNFIIDNMDDLCRIYSIPKLGKTCVVNHILDRYSPIEVWDALEMYK